MNIMGKSYLPRDEAGRVAFMGNVAEHLVEEPQAWGFDAAEAAAYAGVQAAFASAWQRSQQATSRSHLTVGEKNDAMAEAVAATRAVVARLEAWPGMSDDKRRRLGLTVAAPRRRRIPRPDTAPLLSIDSVRGRRVRLRIDRPTWGNHQTPHGKPPHARGSMVMTHIGETFPPDPAAWRFERNTGQSTLDIQLPHHIPPGTKVWFTACWFNPRFQNGPMAVPVAGWVQHGV